jgi:hypothetical protein
MFVSLLIVPFLTAGIQLYFIIIIIIIIIISDLRTNGDLCHLQHKLSDFYSRVCVCLLRGTS